jgi:hypothetical protein
VSPLSGSAATTVVTKSFAVQELRLVGQVADGRSYAHALIAELKSSKPPKRNPSKMAVSPLKLDRLAPAGIARPSILLLFISPSLVQITFFKIFFPYSQKKKPSHLFLGNPAIFHRPVAFRPYLTAGLAFSQVQFFTNFVHKLRSS